MNIFLQLKNMKNLTDNEKQIAKHILDNPEEFMNQNASEIANVCFVSIPTIYRLCQKLEVSGLSELKVKVSGSLDHYIQEEDFNFDFPIQQYQTHYEIMTNLKKDYEQTVLSTFNMFDLKEWKTIINAMDKAKYIDIYTSAGNVFFAENFQFQMNEIGKRVYVPIEDYQQRLNAANSDEKHFAIVISFHGRGVSVNSVIKILNKNHTPILLISSIEPSMIKGHIDYQIYLCSHEDHYKKISSYSTRLSLLYILDILYTCYFERHYQDNIDKKLDLYKKLAD